MQVRFPLGPPLTHAICKLKYIYMSSEIVSSLEAPEQYYSVRNREDAQRIAHIIHEKLVEVSIARDSRMCENAFERMQMGYLGQSSIVHYSEYQIRVLLEEPVDSNVSIILHGSTYDDAPEEYACNGEIPMIVSGLDVGDFTVVVPMHALTQTTDSETRELTIFLRTLRDIVHQLGAIGAKRRKNIVNMLHPFMEKILYYMNA